MHKTFRSLKNLFFFRNPTIKTILQNLLFFIQFSKNLNTIINSILTFLGVNPPLEALYEKFLLSTHFAKIGENMAKTTSFLTENSVERRFPKTPVMKIIFQTLVWSRNNFSHSVEPIVFFM